MHQNILIGLVLTLIIAIFIPVYWATESGRQDAARERLTAAAVETGAELYVSNCAACHGYAGEGFIGPALKDSPLDEVTLAKTIARGSAGAAMPAFDVEEGGPLKENQIDDLVTFVKHWDSDVLEELVAAAGILEGIEYDPNTPEAILLSGKSTFESSCSACHELPSTQRLKEFTSDEALLTFNIHMTEKAELPLIPAERVIRYLLALRHDTAPTPTDGTLEDIEYDPNTPEAVLLSGKSTFEASCSACHSLPTTQRLKEFTSDEALLTFNIDMTQRAELPLEEAEEVIRYLLALRHDTAPTPTDGTLEDIEYDPSTPEALLLSGKSTFEASCSACHSLPTTQRLKEFTSDEALLTFNIDMTERAELPLEDAEEVIRYLLALRHDTAPTPTDGTLEDIEYDPSTPEAVLLSGKTTFEASCSACHDLPSTQRMKEFTSDDTLVTFNAAMTELVDLSLEDAEEVIRYLLALRHDTAPTPEWTPVESLEDIEYNPNTPESVLLSGKSTFESSCSACHELPTTQRIKEFISNDDLIIFNIAMTGVADLPLEDAEKVIRYVLALRNDTAP